MIKYHSTYNGFSRVYYKQKGSLVCLQESSRNEFSFYACSRDGEPSHQIELPNSIPLSPGNEPTDLAVNIWINSSFDNVHAKTD